MFDMELLGRRIQQRRKAQALTQDQLGSELGVSAQSVSRWENGESAPDIALIPHLCQVLRFSSDVLLGVESGVGVETQWDDIRRRLSGLGMRNVKTH